MGASCSSMDGPTSVASITNVTNALRKNTTMRLTSTDRTLRASVRKPKTNNQLGVTNYDTDDEEEIDYSKLPEYARDMIINLKKEEDEIESEDVDPILLTKIRPDSLKYEFVRENGTKQVFRAESLIDYMLSTQHFHDPETRIEFTDDQLVELDVLGEQLGKPSVFAAKLGGDVNRQKAADDADAFTGVERFCGEHVYRMLRIIEKAKANQAQEGEAALLIKCFPFYRHYLTLMFKLDRTATFVAIDQYKRFLMGPPNRPTQDRAKTLLKFCLNYIDEVTHDLCVTEGIEAVNA